MPKRKNHFEAKEINALLEISKAISSGLYLEDVLRLIVTVTANLMDSKICSLWILDEKTNKLKLKATQSISEEYIGVTKNIGFDRDRLYLINEKRDVLKCKMAVGVPPEDMKKLFDPFFSTKEGGVGLGLSIAHRIMDQHHGKIEAESHPGEGTLFNLWLPIHQEEEDADRSRSLTTTSFSLER